MSEPAIAVQGLRKSFAKKEAVAGIDLEIAAGSLAGLVGPNGAGKTTSLSMMTGLLRPDAGRVVIHGHDVWADPAAAKAVIGVVTAEVRLFERLSGEELLEYSGRLRGLPATEARSRAAQLLEVLDLTAFVLEATALCGRRELRAYFSGQDIVYGAIAIPLLVGVSIVLGVLVGDLTEGVSAAVRLPVLFGCAAAYGLGLAWLGVRAAAALAEGRLPELCQIAMRTSL